MRGAKQEKKRGDAQPGGAFQRAPVPEPPKLPEAQRAFFDILLRELAGGLLESEKALRRGAPPEALLRGNSRLRATVAYARALLRLEELDQPNQQDQPGQPNQPNQPDQPEQPDQPGQPNQPEQTELPALLNLAVNGLRRSFLYAGVAVRRAEEEPPFVVRAPREQALFLLEEMLACCLRCAPEGRSLHIHMRPIGPALLLGLRTEGPVLRQSPLIPLLPSEGESDGGDAPAEEDYGFAMCRVLAARLGWPFRWEADEAGVRMFVDISNKSIE
ncbi:MAG: hypothetical protein FWE98_08700 [Oscillospiraceae bacterium]|nr:hypothetical protein [Oscillospiraceae bacterium]